MSDVITGVILDAPRPLAQNVLHDSASFALVGGRRCSVTDQAGRMTIDVPPHHHARILAQLPPDTVLSMGFQINGQQASYTDNEGNCWCVSNLDTKPSLFVVKLLQESGTFTATTFPSVIGMTICVDLISV